MLGCRGVRGATVALADTSDAILAATQELLLALVEANNINVDDVACMFFTTTADLTAQFPALAARKLGWSDLALLGAVEMDVAGSVERCIRVLMLWNTDRQPSEIIHCYLGDAARLRPERAKESALLELPAFRSM